MTDRIEIRALSSLSSHLSPNFPSLLTTRRDNSSLFRLLNFHLRSSLRKWLFDLEIINLQPQWWIEFEWKSFVLPAVPSCFTVWEIAEHKKGAWQGNAIFKFYSESVNEWISIDWHCCWLFSRVSCQKILDSIRFECQWIYSCALHLYTTTTAKQGLSVEHHQQQEPRIVSVSCAKVYHSPIAQNQTNNY